MTHIIGHRGGRNLWPENSLHGFRQLLSVPVEGVELDIHLSDAGELLVIHDATLDRTTDGTGPVRALTPEARGTVRLKDGTEGIPVLSDVLEILADTTLELHLEIKSDGDGKPYPGLPARVLRDIDRFGLRDRCCLTGFDLDVLRQCRDLAPDVRRLCSVNAASAQALGLDATIRAAGEMAHWVAVHKALFAAEMEGILAHVPLDRLGAWVTNTPDEIDIWLAVAPGFITTDEPILAVDRRSRIPAGSAQLA